MLSTWSCFTRPLRNVADNKRNLKDKHIVHCSLGLYIQWNSHPPVQCLHSEPIWPTPLILFVTDRCCAPGPQVGEHPFRWRYERKGNTDITFSLHILVPVPVSAFSLGPEAGVVALPCDCTLIFCYLHGNILPFVFEHVFVSLSHLRWTFKGNCYWFPYHGDSCLIWELCKSQRGM